MLSHAGYLHKGGFSLLLYDSRHRGQSEGSDITLAAREPLDVKAAVNYLKERPDVDIEFIGVQGISLGAVSGILAAAEMPELKGVVAESAFADLSTAIADGFRVVTGLPSFPFAPVAELFCECRLDIDIEDVAPINVIGRISPRAVFLIHDGEDKQLRVESVRKLHEAVGEHKEELWVIPGAPHGKGWQTAPEEYERRVLAFWRETFGMTHLD